MCCVQLEPSSLLSRVPLPLSQGVLLSLVRNLSFDLVKDTGNKLQWIKEAALALDPYDPRLVPHLRGYLGQCYQNCYQMISTTKNQSEQSTLKLISHVINSLLSTCNWLTGFGRVTRFWSFLNHCDCKSQKNSQHRQLGPSNSSIKYGLVCCWG